MPQIVAWEKHERMRSTRVLNAVMQHNAGALNECARVRQRVHVEIAIAIKRERERGGFLLHCESGGGDPRKATSTSVQSSASTCQPASDICSSLHFQWLSLGPAVPSRPTIACSALSLTDFSVRNRATASSSLTTCFGRFVGKAPDAQAGSLDHHTHAHTRTQSLDDCPNWANDESNHHSATLATCVTVYHCSTHDQS
jgi:hypothetical protein